MEARGELEKAKEIAIDASESRQRIINAALQNMAVRGSTLASFPGLPHGRETRLGQHIHTLYIICWP